MRRIIRERGNSANKVAASTQIGFDKHARLDAEVTLPCTSSKNSCRTRCKFVSAASGRNDVDAHVRDWDACGFVFVFALMLAAGFFPAAGKAAGKN